MLVLMEASSQFRLIWHFYCFEIFSQGVQKWITSDTNYAFFADEKRHFAALSIGAATLGITPEEIFKE